MSTCASQCVVQDNTRTADILGSDLFSEFLLVSILEL
jgi:hypothetical protein